MERRKEEERRKELEDDGEYVRRVMKEGAEKSRVLAQSTVNEVKRKMGLL